MTAHPSMVAIRRGVRRSLDQLVEPGPVLVACSGGADSLALLSASVLECRRLERRVVGVTVDHGLQPGSAQRAQWVVEQMRAMGADESVAIRAHVDTASGMGPEAAAREARHTALNAQADRVGASVILLGHTLDDQAETVLLGLTRGSGGRSLAGMRRRYDRVARPLLDVRRSETAAACRAAGLEPWQDPHNDDPGFARVRVRTRVMPNLEAQLGPSVAQALARTADLLREDSDFLDACAHEVALRVAGPKGLAVAPLETQHPALRRRVLHAAAITAGCPPAELTYHHVSAVDALLTDWHGQRWIDLPGPVRARRVDGWICFDCP